MDNEKRFWAEDLLREKYEQLGLLPQKDDFDEVTRARIKAFLVHSPGRWKPPD